MRCWNSPAVQWSSLTTVGSWTAWQPTSWSWEGTDENPDQWYWFEGNFESYEKNKIERLGPEAAKPHRVVHRKLTR